MKKLLLPALSFSLIFSSIFAQQKMDASTTLRVKTANGEIEGSMEKSGVRSFKGVPFAAPPTGDLRWKEPQPVSNLEGTRPAKEFGPNGMQWNIFGDMAFRSKKMGEDCLYLNVWAPSKGKDLPVLVYFYGGGFVAGDGSELRYDGESMATKGIVAITVNYRLGVFGFMSHPELTKESAHHASGNYGLLDQAAALAWVQKNIAAFGGDPAHIVIAGESAGSVSVSALMASPLSKNIIAGAIGESGSLLGTLSAAPLSKGEATGEEFAKTLSATSISALRAMSAEQVLEASKKFGAFRFSMTIDGYFLPKNAYDIFESGEQAHVPLLVGWNSEEVNYRMIMGNDKPTVENFKKAVQKLYGEKADEAMKVYNPTTDEEAEHVATDLSSDRFIAFSTWKWADLQMKTGSKPVYRYIFSRPRPEMSAAMGNAAPGLAGGVVKNNDASAPKPPQAKGAVHSAEIEYAMGNLATNKVYAWTPDDFKVSGIMQNYFANFIKTFDPNGNELPKWPASSAGNVQVINIDVNTAAQAEQNRQRYLFMDEAAKK